MSSTSSLNSYIQNAPICKLPPKVFNEICRRLDVQSIVACAQACKEWNERLIDISGNTFSIWKEIFTQRFPNQHPHDVQNFQQSYKKAYEDLVYSQNLACGTYASSPILKMTRHIQEPTVVAIAGGNVFMGSGSGEIESRNLTTHQILHFPQTTQNQPVTSFAFTDDGKLLVGYRNGPIEIRDPNNGQIVRTLDTQGRKVYSLACNDELLFYSQNNDLIRVLDIKTHTTKQMINQGGDLLLTVADGMLIASCSRESTIKIWDLKTFNLIKSLQSDLQWISSLTVDNKILFISSTGQGIEIWNLDTFERIARIKPVLLHNTITQSLGFSNGKLFVFSTKSLFEPSSDITEIDFRPKRAAALYEIANQLENRDTNIVHFARESLLRMAKLKENEKLAEIYHSDSSPSELAQAIRLYLMQGSKPLSNEAYLFSRSLLHTLDFSSQELQPLEKVTSIAVSDEKMVTGSISGDIQVRDLATERIATIKTLPSIQSQQINSIAITDETLLVSYLDGPIEVWNLNTYNLVSALGIPGKKVYSLVYANGRVIYSCGNFIQVRNIKTWEIEKVLTLPNEPKERVYSLAVADGVLIAGCVNASTGSSTSKIKIWDLKTFELFKILESELEWVTSLAVGDDEKLFVGSRCGKIETWDLHTFEREVTRLEPSPPPKIIRFLNFLDGTLFVSSATSFLTPLESNSQINIIQNKQ
jgi:WD40 repeat protein